MSKINLNFKPGLCVLLFFCYLFNTCSTDTSVNSFGGGSETVALIANSHSISGKITSTDNIPRNTYKISLYSSTYSPLLNTSSEEYMEPITSSKVISISNFSDTTTPSADGLFTFYNLSTGSYNLFIFNADTLKASMIKTIQIDTATIHLYEDTLRETGNFKLTVENAFNNSIAFLSGTPFKSPVGENNLFTFSKIPQGDYELIFISGGDQVHDSLPEKITITIEKGKTNYLSIISK